MTTHFLPINEVIPAVQRYLVERIEQAGGATLVLLSGGSAIGVYTALRDLIQQGKADNVILGLIDERFGPAGHEHSNARAIAEQTQLIGVALTHGVETRMILTGHTIDEEVESYQEWLRKALQVCSTRIGILGVGADGHIAGMLPGSDESTFERLFNDPNILVQSYESADYGQRITVTLPLLRQLTDIVVTAPGSGKRVVIERSIATSGEPIYQLPARVLSQLQNVAVWSADA